MKSAKRTTTLIILALFVAVFGAVSTHRGQASAYSMNVINAFDDSNVYTDLSNATVNGAAFDFADYPAAADGSPQLLQLKELNYSSNQNYWSGYALYLYIYNPSGINFDTTLGANSVQLATHWDSEERPTNFVKFTLKYCNRSEASGFSGRFYKFRVVDKLITARAGFINMLDSESRRYDVSGFELKTSGDTNSTEYTVGGTYIYTGYSAGWGTDPDAASTLACTVNDLATVELDVDRTTWRSGVSAAGEGHQNQLDTVYFSVPTRYETDYGSLQKIKATWHEYKIRPLVTCNFAMYLTLLGDRYSNWIDIDYTGRDHYLLKDAEHSPISFTLTMYDWAYGYDATHYNPEPITSYVVRHIDRLPLVFYVGALSLDTAIIPSSTISTYINGYGTANAIDVNGRQLSGNLFEADVDEGRTRGANIKTIDSNDTFNMMSYDSAHSWWEKLLDFGLWAPETSGDYYDVSPIYKITSADRALNDTQFAKNLYIDSADASTIKTAYDTAAAAADPASVYLFRFAMTDYLTEGCCFDKVGDDEQQDVHGQAYLATETVFLDFDIIELTFNRDGKYIVIPVASSPIDIVPQITPPLAERFAYPGILIILILIAILVGLFYFDPARK